VSGEVIGLFQPGDKVRAKIRSYTGKGMTTYTGLIEFVHERFITVHTGKYRVTVSTAATDQKELHEPSGAGRVYDSCCHGRKV
jgi:hypothetical protein